MICFLLGYTFNQYVKYYYGSYSVTSTNDILKSNSNIRVG